MKYLVLPILLIVIIIGISGFSIYWGGKFLLADMAHRDALDAVSKNQGLVAYQSLARAEVLNPYIDLYMALL